MPWSSISINPENTGTVFSITGATFSSQIRTENVLNNLEMPVLWCPRHQFGSGSQILPGASLDDHTSCTCCTLVTPNGEALYPGPLLICGLMWLDCLGIFSMTKALMPLTGPHIPYNARLTLILNPPLKGLMILVSAIAASFLFSKNSFISLSFFWVYG